MLQYTHYDPDAERAVLGACVQFTDAFGRVRSLLKAQHFYVHENSIVYAAMEDMWSLGEQIDMITINQYLFRHGMQNEFLAHKTPAAYMAWLMQSVYSPAHIQQHALILRNLHAERLCLQLQRAAIDENSDAVTRMMQMQQQIDDALQLKTGSDWHDMSQVMMNLQSHMQRVQGKDLLGVPTPFPSLNRATNGLQPGQLVIIGARPSVGKSAFAGAIALHAAQHGHHTGIISLEMPEEQVGARLCSLYSDVEFWRIYRNRIHPDDTDRLFNHMTDMAGLPIYISDKTNVTAGDIRGRALSLHRSGKLHCLMIDYLQLVEAEGRNHDTREREVARLSRALKLMAMELQIPVIVLCQLNRMAEARTDRRPRLGDLRESGALEQDADIVMLLHRDWKAGITEDALGNTTEYTANIILEKNRNGACTDIPIHFDPERIRFWEEDVSAWEGERVRG